MRKAERKVKLRHFTTPRTQLVMEARTLFILTVLSALLTAVIGRHTGHGSRAKGEHYSSNLYSIADDIRVFVSLPT